MLNKEALLKKIEEEQGRKKGLNKEALLAKIKAEQSKPVEEPEIDRIGLWESIKYNFLAPKIHTMSPGLQGLIQSAIKGVGETYGEVVEPIHEGLEQAIRRDKPITLGKSANNLVQGGAAVAVDMPRFIANVIADPAGTLAQMGEWGIDVSNKSIGALTYATLEFVTDPITGESLREVLKIPAETEYLDVLKKDFEDIATDPINPLMLVMIASGMVEGAGKLAGVKKTKLLTTKERLDPANIKVAQPKVLVEGQKPVTVADMAGRLKQIDEAVIAFWEKDTPLPNYSEGTLRRTVDRLAEERTYRIDPDALVEKAQRAGDLSKSGIKVQDEMRMQVEEQLTAEASAINEILDLQKKQHEAYNKASKKTWQDRKDILQRNVVDAAGTVKRILTTFGAAGVEATRYHDLARGASSEATRQFDIQSKNVFGKVKAREVDNLGLYLQGERTIETDVSKGQQAKSIKGEIAKLEAKYSENLGLISRSGEGVKELKKQAEPEYTIAGQPRKNLEVHVNELQRAGIKLDKDISELKGELRLINKKIDEALEAGEQSPELVARQKEMKQKGRTPQKLTEMQMKAAEIKGQIQHAKGQLTQKLEKESTAKERQQGRGQISRLKDANKQITKDLEKLRENLKKTAIQHPYGKGRDKWELFLKTIDRTWGVDQVNRIRAAAEEFHVAMRDNLDALRAEGLLNDASYKALARYAKYEPRKFLQHEKFDPVVKGQWKGESRSVNSSGVRSLEEGSIEPIINNPKLLLWEVTSRTQGRIFNNRAAQSLLKVAEDNPNNGIINLAGEGDIPAGYTTISAVRDGKQYDMWMSDNLAAEWLLLPPEIKSATATMARHLTGQKILKPMATGINPEFIVANLPRDIGHIYLTTSEYSKWMPIYTGQILKDIGVVFSDAIRRKGRYVEYIKEGGGMEFLTGQGQVIAKTPTAEPIVLGLRKVQDGLSYLNETSEIITRLALRERAIRNGKSPSEATWIARNYMDFAQGGLLSKSVDTVFPYFNAGIVGTRGVTRAAIKDPVTFGIKIANIGVTAMALWHMNRFAYPDLMDGVSDITKNNNWIIGLPWTKIDRGVKRRYYLKIPKDQGQRLFTSAFEAMCDLAYDGKFPARKFFQGIGDAIPVMPNTLFPPMGEVLAAILGDVDIWKWEKIYKGPYRLPEHEYDPNKTSPLAIKAGEISAKAMGKARLYEPLSGLASPMRLETAQEKLLTYYNPYRDGLAWAGKYFLDDLPEEQREMMTQDTFKRIPGLRRLLSLSNPESKRYEESTAFTREENSRTFQQDLKVEGFADGGDRDGYVRWRDTQPREDRERLEGKWRREWTDRKRLVDRFPKFWLSEARKPPRVRAYSLYKEWSKLDNDKEKQKLLDMVWEIPGFKSELTYRHFKNFQREGSK